MKGIAILIAAIAAGFGIKAFVDEQQNKAAQAATLLPLPGNSPAVTTVTATTQVAPALIPVTATPVATPVATPAAITSIPATPVAITSIPATPTPLPAPPLPVPAPVPVLVSAAAAQPQVLQQVAVQPPAVQVVANVSAPTPALQPVAPALSFAANPQQPQVLLSVFNSAAFNKLKTALSI